MDIITKVRNILNKTTANGASLAESATAAKIAQKLLEEHNLSLAMLNNSISEEIENKESIYSGNRIIKWKGFLGVIIANANNCRLYYQRSYLNIEYRLVGRKSDTDIVKYLFDYCLSEIERLCKIEQRIHGGYGKTWSNNFKLGAAHAISEKLKEGKKEARAECANSIAIVKLENKSKEIDDWINNNLKLKYKNNSPITFDKSAFEIGKTVGRSINLNITSNNRLLNN
jgi:hypothetical protein